MHTELDKKRNTYVKMENDTAKSHHEYDQLLGKKGKKVNYTKLYQLIVLEFKFWFSQILHSIANGLPLFY